MDNKQILILRQESIKVYFTIINPAKSTRKIRLNPKNYVIINRYSNLITVPAKIKNRKSGKSFSGAVIVIFLLFFVLLPVKAAAPPGVTTAPYTVSYSGRLTNSSGIAITTLTDLRFSIWNSNDFNTVTDLLPGGTINPAAPNYTGWTETHTVTPDSNGLFHVRLGSFTTLPNFTAGTDIYLQVEVKANPLPLTSFEVLDPDGNTANATDRYPIDSSAFSINADTVDNYDAGNGANQLPVLDGSGLLPISTIPGGTNSLNFTLDNSDIIPPGGPGSIKLVFGNTLNKFLEYDAAASWFNFNDDVNISGNLTVTGTINGTFIGPYNQSIAYEPEYNDSVIQPDGTGNKGKIETLFIDNDGIPGNANINYYVWSTTQLGLQDMDIVIRAKLPEGFVSWQAIPVTFNYRTLTALAADNQVDISIEDTAGNPVTLTGGSGLVSNTFTTTNITFGGAPVWTAGQPITIKIKLTAKNSGAAYAGLLKLNINGS